MSLIFSSALDKEALSGGFENVKIASITSKSHEQRQNCIKIFCSKSLLFKIAKFCVIRFYQKNDWDPTHKAMLQPVFDPTGNFFPDWNNVTSIACAASSMTTTSNPPGYSSKSRLPNFRKNFAILKKNLTILERFRRFGDKFCKNRALKVTSEF